MSAPDNALLSLFSEATPSARPTASPDQIAAAILISLLLQNGVEPAALARTMGRLGDGTAPASVIGAIVDLLAAPPCQGARNAQGSPP